MARSKTPLTVTLAGGIVTVEGRDCLDAYTDDGRRVFVRINNKPDARTDVEAERRLADKLLEVAKMRVLYGS